VQLEKAVSLEEQGNYNANSSEFFTDVNHLHKRPLVCSGTDSLPYFPADFNGYQGMTTSRLFSTSDMVILHGL
jgi:hypothetical protein